MLKNVNGLNDYVEHIKGLLAARGGFNAEAQIKSVRVDEGSRYYKIVVDGSVHSFICRTDMGKFCNGDILKAASWKTPAKNFPRGNIYRNDYGSISWTGA